MPLDRRDLFKASGAALGVALLEGCARREPVYIEQPLERSTVPPGASLWRTGVCGQCEAGCGITVRTVDGNAKKIEGNREHPTSRGGVCALGHSALQALYDPDRVTMPLRRTSPRSAGAATGAGAFAPAGWEEALRAVGEAIAAARGASPARIAVVSGDDGVAGAIWSRLLLALGAPPLVLDEPFDRLVERSAAHRVFGAAVAPSYDLERADMVLGLGAAFLDRWRSPVAYARALAEMRARGGRFVHAEPRLSLTAAAADLWLPVRSGTEGVLARALAGVVLAAGRASEEGAARYRELFPGIPPDLETAARTCDVALARLHTTARALLAAERPVVVAGGAAALSRDGLASVAAGQALNLLVGAVGRPGGVTVEGGVDWLAALAPDASAPEPLAALRRRLEAREVDLLLVADADPLHRAPASWRLDELVRNVPLVVAITSALDDTALEADWVLPAQVDLERYVVAGAHPAVATAGGGPVLSVARGAVEPLGEARHPAEVALALAAGQEQLSTPVSWQGLQEVVVEALGGDTRFVASPRESRRAIDGGARAGFLVAAAPAPSAGDSLSVGEAFPEPAGTGDDDASQPAASLRLVPFESIKAGDGRGANRPWLQELPDPLAPVMWASWVELSPRDAATIGVHTGDWVRLRAASSSGDAAPLEMGVVVSLSTRPGTVAAPLGHGHRDYGRYARGRGVNLMGLVHDEQVEGCEAPALLDVRVLVERLARPPRKLALYGRGLGDPEHLPRGWGAHESAPARPAGTEGTEGGSR
jgi:menaquinone reductase, molybdopterin-binding-like subunit